MSGKVNSRSSKPAGTANGAPAASGEAETEKPSAADMQLARTVLDPIATNACIAGPWAKGTLGRVEVQCAYEVLAERAKAVRDGKLASVEDMLTGQAAALNAIFLELTRRAGLNMGEYVEAAKAYMRLALRAQSQCRATLETLAAVKNPPLVYAKQANIAAGHQQVNNGAPRAAAIEKAPNELLEAAHVERLDGGAASGTIGRNPEVATVGALDRSPN